MESTITIKSDFLSNDELYASFSNNENNFRNTKFFLIGESKRGLPSDPTILIALITAGNAAITAIIVGIFKILEKKTRKKF